MTLIDLRSSEPAASYNDRSYDYKSEDPNDRKIWVTEPGTGSQQ